MKYESQELTNINRYIDGAADNKRNGRLLIAKGWFETDAYGAAVEGILTAIELGLSSGSIGRDREQFILETLRVKLMEMDPALKKEV